jgi:dTDP-4-dehydrorhamnose 3,5-epimerase-like enzyme
MTIINFPNFEDERGNLLPIEFENLNFIPKRVFFINNVPKNCERGGHAHFETKQFIICLKGEIEVILDDGHNESQFVLKKNQGGLIPNLIWDKQKFLEEDSELLVLCSTSYDVNDYIFDFSEFKNIIKKFKLSKNNKSKEFKPKKT